MHELLARAGLGHDRHGAAAYRPDFSRTKSEWRTAAQGWLDNPVVNQGAMMTSLLVDARPVWGDTGLPAVARVFDDLRAHPLTMQLLLKEIARLPRPDAFGARPAGPAAGDVRHQGARPAADHEHRPLGARSAPGPPRCRRPSGCASRARARCCRPRQARTLAEVFEVLQGLRLEAQLDQIARGEHPSDVLRLEHLSPLDRSVIASAVREIATVQRRMDNLAAWLPADEWAVS